MKRSADTAAAVRALLLERQPLTGADVARELLLDRDGLARTLRRLDADVSVERAPGRTSVLSLTAAGLERARAERSGPRLRIVPRPDAADLARWLKAPRLPVERALLGHGPAVWRRLVLDAAARLGVDVPRPTAAPPPPESERRALPMLRLGPGDRRESCDHYGGCLRRFASALLAALEDDDDAPGHCAPDCAAYVARDRDRELLHTATARPPVVHPDHMYGRK